MRTKTLNRVLASSILAVALPAFAGNGPASFTYEGRLLDTSDNPVNGSVTFQVQVYDPGASCLLRDESFTQDLTSTNGYFSLSVGTGTPANDDPGLALINVMTNGSALIGLSGCSYTPAQGASRIVRVIVNGTAMSPDLTLGSAPFAMSANNIQGYVPQNFISLDASGTNANTSPLNGTQYGNLVALVNGTSSQYMKASSNGTAALPVFTTNGTPTTLTAGSIWYDSSTNTMKFYNGSGTQTLGTSSGGVTSVATGAGLSGGPITATGTISLAAFGTAGNYYQVTTDAYGRVSSGVSTLSGNAIVSGTIGGSTALNTTGSISTSNTLSVSNTTASTSTSTGAVVVSGGLGVGGNVNSTVHASAAGTASAPGHSFITDSASGLFQPGAATLGLSTSGVERLRITNNGSIGVGTTQPAAQFDLFNSAPSSMVNVTYNAVTGVMYPAFAATTYSNYSLPALVTLASARGTIGSPAASQNGDPLAAIYASGQYDSVLGHQYRAGGLLVSASENWSTSSAASTLSLLTTASGTTSPVTRMMIDSTGRIGIGSASPAYMLDVNGSANVTAYYKIAGMNICSSSGCTSSSDRRLKENIQPLEGALDKVLQLQGVEYDYRDKTKFGDQHQIGVIAQDVEAVYPEVVIKDAGNGYRAVAYDHLVAPLIESVKALYARITASDARISALEAENAELKARLDKIEKAVSNATASH